MTFFAFIKFDYYRDTKNPIKVQIEFFFGWDTLSSFGSRLLRPLVQNIRTIWKSLTLSSDAFFIFFVIRREWRNKWNFYAKSLLNKSSGKEKNHKGAKQERNMEECGQKKLRKLYSHSAINIKNTHIKCEIQHKLIREGGSNRRNRTSNRLLHNSKW